MKFIKSLSFPVLSLALISPMTNASADIKTTMQNALKQTREAVGSVIKSAKNKVSQIPSFSQMRAMASQKLGLEKKKGFKAAIADAQDAIITYSIVHPYAVLSIVAAIAFGAGFLLARNLRKAQKNR